MAMEHEIALVVVAISCQIGSAARGAFDKRANRQTGEPKQRTDPAADRTRQECAGENTRYRVSRRATTLKIKRNKINHLLRSSAIFRSNSVYLAYKAENCSESLAI